MQVSQEAGKVVWYSYLFKNFPQFVVIHTVKSFGIANNTRVHVFLELSFFFYDPKDVRNLIFSSSSLSAIRRVTIYSLDELLFLFGTSLLFHVQF